MTGAALVVGGSGAIGGAICRAIAARGSDVAITARSGADSARNVAADVEGLGNRSLVLEVDLDEPESLAGAVQKTVDYFGSLDTLVYAAGVLPDQMWCSTVDTGKFRAHLVSEAVGCFASISYAIPHLRETAGSVVAVTSVAVRRNVLRDVLSASPKAAIEALIRSIAAEEGRYGLRANAVGVGLLADGMAQKLVDSGGVAAEAMRETEAALPMRRLGKAVEIAEVVSFLASPSASYVTGQVIDVDGGYSV
ncbi:MAG TPA: dehydrogenase [Acidimicrobiaceae bacterium]|nr:dehydrogenase [Acidimicrobiaceae bacterium]